MPTLAAPKVIKEASGKVRLRFGKTEHEFASMDDLRAWAREFDREDMERLTARLMLARQPNLANPAAFEGRSVEVDFSKPAWGTIS